MGKPEDDDYAGVVPLANPGDLSDDPKLRDLNLTMNKEGRAEYAGTPQKSDGGASLSGPAPKYSHEAHPAERMGLAGTRAADAGGYSRPPPQTPEQMLAHYQSMLDNMSAQHQALEGNSLSARSDTGTQVPAWLENYMRTNR